MYLKAAAGDLANTARLACWRPARHRPGALPHSAPSQAVAAPPESSGGGGGLYVWVVQMAGDRLGRRQLPQQRFLLPAHGQDHPASRMEVAVVRAVDRVRDVFLRATLLAATGHIVG